MIPRRSLPLFVLALLSTLAVLTAINNGYWRHLPQLVGYGEAIKPTEDEIREGVDAPSALRIGRPNPGAPRHSAASTIKPAYAELEDDEGEEEEEEENDSGFEEPVVENTSPYPIGETKPPGDPYTKCLVIARTKKEDTSWVQDQLADVLADGHLDTAIYVVDDARASNNFRVPKNKGHEAMVYLTYIIDHYDALPDVAIFMHAHQYAWHNNELLYRDAALMVRHLNPARVAREGYMNLRCHWDPGCPNWLHPGTLRGDEEKPEEVLIAQYWAQLFPFDPIPEVLAQPCCAQFAVSRARLRALPRRRYAMMRDWLVQTELSDYFSGRVFEYAWQFVFSATPVHCPSMSVCYCDGYGICFGGPEPFDRWFQLRHERDELLEKLRVWRSKADRIEDYRAASKWGEVPEEAPLQVPEVGRNKWLSEKIDRLSSDMDAMLELAIENGKDPQKRALEAGRPWKEGDGY